MSLVARAATDAGWELTPRELVGFNGDKRIGGIAAQIVISGLDQDDTVWVDVSSRAECAATCDQSDRDRAQRVAPVAAPIGCRGD